MSHLSDEEAAIAMMQTVISMSRAGEAVTLGILRALIQRTRDKALEEAAQATRCYKCEAEIRAKKSRE
jgi:hypothetical protein